MLKRVINSRAIADIGRINDWYLQNANQEITSRFFDDLHKEILNICKNPERYKFVHKEIQRCIKQIFPFVIFFSKQEDTIVIFRVRHKKQRILKRY